jgi:hypothetical protein
MKTLALAFAVLCAGCVMSNHPADETDATTFKPPGQAEESSKADRSAYQDEARQQRDRASLIATLTTSRPQ